MAIQKKHGKGRLDKWYKLAKEKGYRARAAFKLIQLNKKYGFLEKSKVVLDLCAAPGSWCQVAVETMPVNSLIVGVDLSPIKPIPKVITFQSDITTDKCRATIRQHLKTWKADTVLHDGAPNVGTAWVQDAFSQAELTLEAMRLATDFLVEGGTFVTKVFRSKDYNSLLWVFNQLFDKVEVTKPPSSRNVSAEIFVVCRGFKAPKHLDPRFTDPKAVFAELADPTPNNEAKVYNPDKKRRKREGYEEGDWTQYKEMPASEFIQTTDPLDVLGNYNKMTFTQPKNGDVALAALDKLPETTPEIRVLCDDLKVLGRKEFKTLLKWRLRVREIFGFPTKKAEAEAAKKPTLQEEVAQVEDMDDDMRIQKELQALKDKAKGEKKRERRKENERKQKEIVRMQLNMTAPMDIGKEQAAPDGADAMFALKAVDKAGATNKFTKGKMVTIKQERQDMQQSFVPEGAAAAVAAEDEDEDEDDDNEDDEEEDRLERELDHMYESFKERKAESDAKYKARKAREEHGDGEWEGVSADEKDHSDEYAEFESDSDDSEGEEQDGAAAKAPHKGGLVRDLDPHHQGTDGLSKRASRFFSQDIFKGMDGLEDEDEADAMDVDEEQEEEDDVVVSSAEEEEGGAEEEGEEESDMDEVPSSKTKNGKSKKGQVDDDKGGFEVVKSNHDEADWEEDDRKDKDGRPDIDLITAEAMTLAHQLATGQKTTHDLIDDNWTKHALRDRSGLPDWFIEDESRHDKPHKPTTKAAADAIREKQRALNARPMKKVQEAQARKKMRTAQKLEKLKKKSDTLLEDENLTEKEKADNIQKMLARANKKKPRAPTQVVVARGANRGVQGRPSGIRKGKYKIVDPRMKKEMRAAKRKAQKAKKRR